MSKVYDLGERTKLFAKECRLLVRTIKLDLGNIEDSKQLVRSSGSVAANYIEANEALSKKDFSHRVKICRKESKESGLWLDLLMITEPALSEKRNDPVTESRDLVKIFSTIIMKSTKSV